MTNALTRKLSRFGPLDDDELAALERLSASSEAYPRHRDLIRQGDRPGFVFLLLKGWAYRYKLLKNGKRQILGYLIPGDLCDLHVSFLKEMDHSIGLLTDAEVALIPDVEIHQVMERHPRIQRALWSATLVDEAILREWLTNMGQRDAFGRIGHHLCEQWARMKSIGLVTTGEEFDLPLTQEEIGDSLGLTPVHVNRTLKRLREEGIVAFRQKRLTVLDPPRLATISGFDATYLHLKEQQAESRPQSAMA